MHSNLPLVLCLKWSSHPSAAKVILLFSELSSKKHANAVVRWASPSDQHNLRRRKLPNSGEVEMKKSLLNHRVDCHTLGLELFIICFSLCCNRKWNYSGSIRRDDVGKYVEHQYFLFTWFPNPDASGILFFLYLTDFLSHFFFFYLLHHNCS